MIEYAILASGSTVGLLNDSLYDLTQWFGGISPYWIVGGVVLFFLFLKKI